MTANRSNPDPQVVRFFKFLMMWEMLRREEEDDDRRLLDRAVANSRCRAIERVER